MIATRAHSSVVAIYIATYLREFLMPPYRCLLLTVDGLTMFSNKQTGGSMDAYMYCLLSVNTYINTSNNKIWI